MSWNRYRVIWAGGPGGEGVSTFYSEDTVTTALADLRAFFDAIKASFPSQISWSFPSSGDTIDLATGQIDGSWSQAAASPVSGGAGTAVFAAGVGLRVRWETGAVRNGRRVRGSTFLTSMDATDFQSDGTIAPSVLSVFQTAADTLAGQGWLHVYSRDFAGGGAMSQVQSATVPDRISWLRSRRT